MIEVQAGRTFDAVLEGAPTGLVGTIGVRLIDPTSQETLVERTTSGITEYPAGSGVYGVSLTAPDMGDHTSPWSVSILWDTVAGGAPLTPDDTFTEDVEIFAGPPASFAPSATFATVDDVARRLNREFTDSEAVQVELLLALATSAIAAAADKTDDWAAALDPVPALLRLLCIEIVVRVLQNPAGAASTTETLGAYSYTERHDSPGANAGLELTEPEERRARRAVYGTNTAGVRVDTIANQLYQDVGGRVEIASDVIADDAT